MFFVSWIQNPLFFVQGVEGCKVASASIGDACLPADAGPRAGGFRVWGVLGVQNLGFMGFGIKLEGLGPSRQKPRTFCLSKHHRHFFNRRIAAVCSRICTSYNIHHTLLLLCAQALSVVALSNTRVTRTAADHLRRSTKLMVKFSPSGACGGSGTA